MTASGAQTKFSESCSPLPICLHYSVVLRLGDLGMLRGRSMARVSGSTRGAVREIDHPTLPVDVHRRFAGAGAGDHSPAAHRHQHR